MANMLVRSAFAATALALAFLTTVAAFSAVNPADYPEAVHVVSSRLARDITGKDVTPTQELNVVIGGKHLLLAGDALLGDVHVIGGIHPGVVPLQDYKARLLPHPAYKPEYLLFLSYELLLPDGKPHRFEVIGVSE